MSHKDLLFTISLAAVVALAATAPPANLPSTNARASETTSAHASDELVVRAAWLAQRESAVGDWESVAPPLRAGDELSLTVRAEADACVYVVSISDGARSLIFPANASPRAACVRGGWQYTLPSANRAWRLDGAAHDRFVLIAARHPIDDPLGAAARPAARALAPASDVELPLRDGRIGRAITRVVSAPEYVVDDYAAR